MAIDPNDREQLIQMLASRMSGRSGGQQPAATDLPSETFRLSDTENTASQLRQLIADSYSDPKATPTQREVWGQSLSQLEDEIQQVRQLAGQPPLETEPEPEFPEQRVEPAADYERESMIEAIKERLLKRYGGTGLSPEARELVGKVGPAIQAGAMTVAETLQGFQQAAPELAGAYQEMQAARKAAGERGPTRMVRGRAGLPMHLPRESTATAEGAKRLIGILPPAEKEAQAAAVAQERAQQQLILETLQSLPEYQAIKIKNPQLRDHEIRALVPGTVWDKAKQLAQQKWQERYPTGTIRPGRVIETPKELGRQAVSGAWGMAFPGAPPPPAVERAMPMGPPTTLMGHAAYLAGGMAPLAAAPAAVRAGVGALGMAAPEAAGVTAAAGRAWSPGAISMATGEAAFKGIIGKAARQAGDEAQQQVLNAELLAQIDPRAIAGMDILRRAVYSKAVQTGKSAAEASLEASEAWLSGLGKLLQHHLASGATPEQVAAIESAIKIASAARVKTIREMAGTGRYILGRHIAEPGVSGLTFGAVETGAGLARGEVKPEEIPGHLVGTAVGFMLMHIGFQGLRLMLRKMGVTPDALEKRLRDGSPLSELDRRLIDQAVEKYQTEQKAEAAQEAGRRAEVAATPPQAREPEPSVGPAPAVAERERVLGHLRSWIEPSEWESALAPDDWARLRPTAEARRNLEFEREVLRQAEQAGLLDREYDPTGRPGETVRQLLARPGVPKELILRELSAEVGRLSLARQTRPPEAPVSAPSPAEEVPAPTPVAPPTPERPPVEAPEAPAAPEEAEVRTILQKPFLRQLARGGGEPAAAPPTAAVPETPPGPAPAPEARPAAAEPLPGAPTGATADLERLTNELQGHLRTMVQEEFGSPAFKRAAEEMSRIEGEIDRLRRELGMPPRGTVRPAERKPPRERPVAEKKTQTFYEGLPAFWTEVGLPLKYDSQYISPVLYESLRNRFGNLHIGKIISKDQGVRIDEAASQIEAKGLVAEGRGVDRVVEELRNLTRLAAKPTGQIHAAFGKPDPDFVGADRVGPLDLIAGEDVMTHDGAMWRVDWVNKETGEAQLSDGAQTIKVGRGFVIPVIQRTGKAKPAVGMVAAREPTRGRAEGVEALEVADAFGGLPAEARSDLMKLAAFYMMKGARTPDALADALARDLGGEGIRPYVQGLFERMMKLPAFRPKEAPSGPVRAGDVERRPGGAEEGRGLPEAEPPRPGERPGEVPPRPTEVPPPAAKAVPAVSTREVRKGGVATLDREKFPALEGRWTVESWFTPAEIERLTSLLGGREPLPHQQENVVRNLRAFVNGTGMVVADGTGTGKTLTAALLIEKLWQFQKDPILANVLRNPELRVIYVTQNEGLMRQAMDDALTPLGFKGHLATVKSGFQRGKKNVNFVTWSTVEKLKRFKAMGLVEAFRPDLIIFDESQRMKNWYDGTRTAIAAEEMSRVASRSMFMSATPIESLLHTGYLTALNLWGDGPGKKSWMRFLEDEVGVRYDAKERKWFGLTSKNLKKLYDLMIQRGVWTKSEIDFHNITDKSGKNLSLFTQNFLVPMTTELDEQYNFINDAFGELFNDPEIKRSRVGRRLAASIYYMVLRALDEQSKVPRAIEIALDALKNSNKSVIITTMRKGDTDAEVMFDEYLQGKREYAPKSLMPKILSFLADRGLKLKSPVVSIMEALREYDPVRVTGDEPAGGFQRQRNLELFMEGKTRVLVMTMPAGGVGLNAQDRIGSHPRLQINLTTPDTGMMVTQVAGRSFRLGSQSDGELFWLFMDTAFERSIADKVAQRLISMGALVRGAVKDVPAEEMIKFDFPEIGEETSLKPYGREIKAEEPAKVREMRLLTAAGPNGTLWVGGPDHFAIRYHLRALGATYDSQYRRFLVPRDKVEEAKKLVEMAQRGELPPEPPTVAAGYGFEPEAFARRRGPPEEAEPRLPGTEAKKSIQQAILERVREIERKKYESAYGEQPEWADETLFGKIRKEEAEKAQGKLFEEKPSEKKEAAGLAGYRQPVVPGVVPSVKGRHRIIEDFLGAIGTTRRRGFMGAVGPKVLAWYKPFTDVIRSRLMNDAEVIAHEAGHRLDKIFFGHLAAVGAPHATAAERAADVIAYRRELTNISTKPLAGGSTLREGFAEFVRLYITRNSMAQHLAPGFYPKFQEIIHSKEFAKIGQAVEGARSDWENYQKGTPEARVWSTIESGSYAGGRLPAGGFAPGPRRGLAARSTPYQLYTAVWDDMFPLREMFRQLMEKKRITEMDPADNAQILASTIMGRWDLARHFVEKGTFKFGLPGEVTGEPLLKIVEALGDRMWLYDVYAKSKRAVELKQLRGWDPLEKVGIHLEDAEYVVHKYGEEMEPYFRRFQDYSRTVLRYLVDGGMMKPETFDAIVAANPDYSILYRLMEDEGGYVTSLGPRRFGDLFSPSKRIKGSDRPTLPVFEAYMKWTMSVIDRVEKNAVVRSFVEMANATGGAGKDFAEEREPDVEIIRLTKYDTDKVLREKGIDPDTIPSAIRERVVSLVRPSWRPPKRPHAWVWIGGDRYYYWLHPDVWDSVMRLDTSEANVVTGLANGAVRALRAGAVVFNPMFWYRSAFRDVLTALHQSDNFWLHASYLVPSLFQALGKTETYWKYVRAGTGMGTFIHMDRPALENYLKRRVKPSSLKTAMNPQRVFMKVLDGIAHFGQALEIMPRLAEAKVRGLKPAVTRGEMLRAGYAGREATVDFSRLGYFTRFWTQYAAFFGPNVAGWDRTMRTFAKGAEGRPGARGITGLPMGAFMRTVTNASSLLMMSMAYYLFMRDDKDWKNLPQWLRDTHWVIRFPGGDWIRLPKPYEYGLLSTVAERIMEATDHEDPAAIEGLKEHFQRQFPNMVPTVVQPVWELAWNKSAFSGRPIVPEYGAPSEAYRYYTSETAKYMARKAKGVPGVGMLPERMRGPAAMEHLARGYTGGLAPYVFRGSDIAAQRIAGEPTTLRPGGGGPAEIPIAGAAFVREPVMETESVRRFYEVFAPAQQAAQSLGKKKREGMPEFRRYLGEEKEAIVNYKRLQPHHEALSKLRQRWYLIMQRKPTTREEQAKQRQELERLSAQMNTRAWIALASIGKLPKQPAGLTQAP